MAIAKRVVLHFPKRMVDRPIVSNLVKAYNLDFNILKASITPDAEGLMVLELIGTPEEYDRGVQYLQDTGVRIQSLGTDITRNEDRCTDCGACITFCPAKAFEVDKKTKKILFQNEKCLACEICIKACPHRAMALHF
jgi:L-aspartate semialdehyde sulfurtransferase ferredoxin